MVTKIMMPKFGLSMETGIIGSWLVKEGDTVKKGSGIAEITTDKISNTCEAPADGVIRKLLADEGDEIACGEPIAVMADTAEEDISAKCGSAVPEATTSVAAAVTSEAAPAAVAAAEGVAEADIKITPRAKKVAAEQGLCYAHITGTGLFGAITIADLKKYGTKQSEQPIEALVKAPVTESKPIAASAAYAPVYNGSPCEGEDVIVKMTGMQHTVAHAMMTSLHTTAQTTIATEAEITKLVKVYRQLKGKYTNAGVKLSYTAMLIKAVAMALENHKALRSTMAEEGHIKISSRIHIGVAIDVPNGLVVPVIRDANMKDLRSICLELAELTEKAKGGKLTGGDMGGGTITITNLGMFGITYFTPVLNLPESAILGVGAITEKLLVKDGTFVPGSVMNFSLTHDHQIINGAPAARFLNEITASLQNFQWA